MRASGVRSSLYVASVRAPTTTSACTASSRRESGSQPLRRRIHVDTPGNLTPNTARKHQPTRRRRLSGVDNIIVTRNDSYDAIVVVIVVVVVVYGIAVFVVVSAAVAINAVTFVVAVAVGAVPSARAVLVLLLRILLLLQLLLLLPS